MLIALAIWLFATILIYRALFSGIPISAKTRALRARDRAIRLGLAWAFPLFGLYLLIAMGGEGIVGLFKREEVAE